jgi:HPt (histidine-containing phosphotransfer) domain-containing protein
MSDSKARIVMHVEGMIYKEIPLIDKVRIDELHSMDEDGTFVTEIIELFTSDSDRSLAELRAAADERDLDRTRKIAHRLKGSALSLGANRFAALASDIEQDTDPASIIESMIRLESLRLETLAELSRS